MLTHRQGVVLAALALAFWLVAAGCLHLDPGAVRPGWRGDLAFALAVPAGWLCVRLVRGLARLGPEQLVVATALVVALDTLLDAAVLRWTPWIYGTDAAARALTAAWLLWGYGASLAAALVMSRGMPANIRRANA